MVTHKIFADRHFASFGITEAGESPSALRVTGAFPCNQEDNAQLARALSEILSGKKTALKKSKMRLLEEDCDIPFDTYKKNIFRGTRPSKAFLMKFCVGLGLTREEADGLFLMHSGVINETNDVEYIFAAALRDGDDIMQFESDVLEYAKTDLSSAK